MSMIIDAKAFLFVHLPNAIFDHQPFSDGSLAQDFGGLSWMTNQERISFQTLVVNTCTIGASPILELNYIGDNFTLLSSTTRKPICPSKLYFT
jgi:hypothetical protein